MSTELLICILTGELSLDGSLQGVSSLLPSIDLAAQELPAVYAPVQALTAEDTDLDLRHIQPTGVLGRVAGLDSAQELCGCARPQHIVEALPEVGAHVVQHQVNSARLGVCGGEQFADEGNEVNLDAMLSDRDDPLSCFGLDRHEQVGRAVARVLVVMLGEGALGHGQRRAVVADELQAWPCVQLKQGVHAVPVLLNHQPSAPHQLAPRLEVVLLSMRRTVSRLTPPRTGSWRATRSSSTIVQRGRPSGGVEQASAVTRASASVSYRRGRPERATQPCDPSRARP